MLFAGIILGVVAILGLYLFWDKIKDAIKKL